MEQATRSKRDSQQARETMRDALRGDGGHYGIADLIVELRERIEDLQARVEQLEAKLCQKP